MTTTQQSAPPVCPKCGKRHPAKWQHAGDCACGNRLSRKPHSIMCDQCAKKARTSTPESQADAEAWVEKTFGRKAVES